MNIILCEPDSQYSEQITRLLLAWGEKYQHQDEIMLQSYQSSEDIFVAWEKGLQIDILLIAAEITDDLSGFEVAHRIQKINWYMPIVLVVDKETVRFDQYGFETLRFLFCPIKEDAFCSCMNICWLQAVENRREIVFLRLYFSVTALFSPNSFWLARLLAVETAGLLVSVSPTMVLSS